MSVVRGRSLCCECDPCMKTRAYACLAQLLRRRSLVLFFIFNSTVGQRTYFGPNSRRRMHEFSDKSMSLTRNFSGQTSPEFPKLFTVANPRRGRNNPYQTISICLFHCQKSTWNFSCWKLTGGIEVHIRPTYLLQTGSKHDVIKVSALLLSRTAIVLMSDVFVQ